jgi:hypothetical protein
MYTTSKKEADSINLDLYLLNRMRENFLLEKDKNGGVPITTQIELEEFLGDGRKAISFFKKNLTKFFQSKGWKLIGIEVPVDLELKNGVFFIGYIDIVVQNGSGDYVIIDLKTSTRGWNQYEKNDKVKNSQILLYKEFYSKQYNVPIEKIKVEYHIYKRKLSEASPYPVPYVSKHIPANGKPSVNKAVGEFMQFIDTVFDDTGERRLDIPYPKEPGKNNKNCRWCEFYHKKICDGIKN